MGSLLRPISHFTLPSIQPPSINTVADVHHSRRQKYSSYDHLLDRSPAFHPGAVLQAPLTSTSSARSRREFTAPGGHFCPSAPNQAQPCRHALQNSSKTAYMPLLCAWKVKVSSAVMNSQGKSFQSPKTTLYVNLVTLTDTLHETVRTASQMQLLLRTSAMIFGRRRTVCKQVSFQRLTS